MLSTAGAVRIMEVGPRDGLQNVKSTIPTAIKIELIERLAEAGLRHIEATSFVSPKWVPQLADGAQVMAKMNGLAHQGISLPVLTPNMRGVQNALKAEAREIVVFASATEAFSKKNQNCTVDEALNQAEQVVKEAQSHGARARGVISCMFSDPYSGPTDPQDVVKVVQRLLNMSCYEVGLGDTLGVGTPKQTQQLLEVLLQNVPAEKLAGHFHDTYGQAVANATAAYDMGVRTFDSSVAGLGGCPYAPGAKGNVATEDLVYSFEKSGIDTGVDLPKLASVGAWISQQLGVANSSRAGAAIVAKSQPVAQATTKVASASSEVKSRTWIEMENTGEFRVDKAGNTVKITLTRSQKGNSMTVNMLEGLTRVYKILAKDRSVFHIVLAAEGKFFCTGMDLGSGTDRTSNEGSYYQKVRDLFDVVDNSPQTTIALVDGPCYGGGVGLSFACDVRLATSKARWTLSEIKLGLSPAIISIYMAREWGLSFFREAMLSGREVSVAELHRIGAVHQLIEDPATANDKLDEYLSRLDKCAPESATTCKELVRLAWTSPESPTQDRFIQKTFDNMMQPGSEGEYGIKQFQQKVKNIDWGAFWSTSRAKL